MFTIIAQEYSDINTLYNVFLLLLFMWISFALADSDRTADSERKQKDYGGLVEALLKLLRVILLK